MMKGTLIDPFARKITDIVVEPGLQAIYDAITADTFCCVTISENPTSWHRNVLYLDDFGRLVDPNDQEYFWYGDFPDPLCGRGLILGVDREGESVDCTVEAEIVALAVRWGNKKLEVMR